MLDDSSSRCSSQGTYSNLNYISVDDQENNVTCSTRKDKLPITAGHKCKMLPSSSENMSAGLSISRIPCNQCKALVGSHAAASTSKNKIVDNRRLTRNRSLIDVHSQMLHRSLLEEVHKRRLFKTVGAVENIGFQSPFEVSSKNSQPAASGKGKTLQTSGKFRNGCFLNSQHTNLRDK